ncbi:uncharacterized protein LOC133890427 [Phragmites australis]|uniref:uncharacterized protein LOC133890427 n=1 Tax=Phragmites australis TaxID=29695 RepID=UPI002D77CAB1|nr:uncharacterized protein LOC133890427 [Phragmites australis]
MAGLVAILRQLGDLAELAAEVFHDLHDQVMAASARGRRLALRAKQLEADLPPIEKDRERHCLENAAASNTDRVDWHADPKVSHGVVAAGGMPCFIAECIDRCRGPPRLFMLDRFAAQGEGACLRRYTDPSFFRTHSAKLQEGTLRANRDLKPMENRQKLQNAENPKPPKSAHTDSKFETDASKKASLGFLSMLRQLKHRQINGSVFTSLKPQMQQNIQKYESSPEEKPSSVDHSEIDMSLTSSPDFNIGTGNIAIDASTAIEKAKDNHQGTVRFEYYSSGAGSDNGGNCNELERTSSFKAWLSPDPRFTPEHEHGIIEEASHGTSEACVSNAITSNAAPSSAKKAKQNPNNAVEISYKKGVGKRSKYKGRVEIIASRVCSLPRKLFMKQQHDPLEPAQAAVPTETDSARSWRSDGVVLWSNGDWCSLDVACPSFREQLFGRASDVLLSPDHCEAYRPDSMDPGAEASITSCNPEASPNEAFPPLLITNPVFSGVDSVAESEQCYLDHESTTRLQSTRGPSYNASVDAEIHHQQNGPSISNQCSTPEIYEEPSSTPDSKKMLSPSMKGSVCMINGPLHEPTTVLPENSCSDGTRAVVPPLPPIPPMQWLSVKVHTGPGAASPKPRTLWTKSPEVNHADMSHSLQSVRTQEAEMIQARSQHSRSSQTSETKMAHALDCNENANPDVSHRHGISRDPLLNKDYEEIIRRQSFRKGKILKTTEFPELTLLSDEALSELAEIDTQPQAETRLREECSSNLHKENVFFSAVEQLAKMSPPSVPRPKYSLLEVAPHDRISLRNGSSMIHPSRNILDSRSVLLEQIKNKVSFSLKPVSGMSSTVMGSPTNSRVATILQRADDIRQAHADGNDVGGEDSWSDSD